MWTVAHEKQPMLSLWRTHANKQASKNFEHDLFWFKKSQMFWMVHSLFSIAQKLKLAMTSDGRASRLVRLNDTIT